MTFFNLLVSCFKFRLVILNIFLKRYINIVVDFCILLEMETGKIASKRGRPKGFNMMKYWQVLVTLLDGPLSFQEVVEKSKLSRRFVWKVLKDALLRDVIGVNYRGHNALYFLKYPELATPVKHNYIKADKKSKTSYIVEESGPPPLFYTWFVWFDRPHINDLLEILSKDEVDNIKMVTEFEIAIFLYERYAHLRLVDEKFYPENYPYPLGGYEYTKIFNKLLKSTRGFKISCPEREIIMNVCRALNERRICPECFKRGELYLLEQLGSYYICRNKKCGKSFSKPWSNSKLLREFKEWREIGSKIKIGKITYYIGGYNRTIYGPRKP